jgi:SSS family solute:Na+ symporter
MASGFMTRGSTRFVFVPTCAEVGFVGIASIEKKACVFMNWQTLLVFISVVMGVSILGFLAARWRASDLSKLREWGLGGRRFGPVVSWFLLGGDIYTAHSFIAAPALIFAQGAVGFYLIPYITLAYPIGFIFLSKFWTVARRRGYITAADFVRERFDSRFLALLVALSGIVATLPYIALQIIGMQLVIVQMGLPTEISLLIAFIILSAYTYFSGLRAPALIAIVKDILIWLVFLCAVIYIPTRLGGFANIFAAVPQEKLVLQPSQYSTYTTLVIGSALALFLYPHTVTGALSVNSRKVLRQNMIFLIAYPFLISLMALMGIMAVAAGIKASPIYGSNAIVPLLFAEMFPSWFVGLVFATLAIGALVPSAIMSIASANLFSRNIYREYFRPSCTNKEESMVAKTVSLVVKFGALVFVFIFPTYSVTNNLQLLGGVWILQTLPVVFLGLYTRWFHRVALVVGLLAGLIVGTTIAISQNFASVYPLFLGGTKVPVYGALIALGVNLLMSVALTPICRMLKVASGRDLLASADFTARPVNSRKLEQVTMVGHS